MILGMMIERRRERRVESDKEGLRITCRDYLINHYRVLCDLCTRHMLMTIIDCLLYKMVALHV